MIKYIFVGIVCVFIYSCTNNGSYSKYPDSESEIRCHCPLNQANGGDITDSLKKISKITESSGGKGEINVNSIFKETIKGKLNLKYEQQGVSFEVKSIVRNIKDKFPKITNYTTFRKDFFCAYVEIICRDSTLNNEELQNIKLQKLKEIEFVLNELYSQEMSFFNNEIKHKPASMKVQEGESDVKSFSLIGFNNLGFINDIKKYTQFGYKHNDADYDIRIWHTGDIVKVHTGDLIDLFVFEGGELRLEVNGVNCDLLKIKIKEVDLSPKEAIQRYIEHSVEEAIVVNKIKIIKTIQNCII